jgi:hypothetical protein
MNLRLGLVACLAAGAASCGQAFSRAGGADASTVDAPDVRTGDVGVAADVRVGGDDGGKGFCAQQASKPFFCDDFDDRGPTMSAGAWSALVVTGGAVGVVSSLASVTAPHSFLAKAVEAKKTGGALLVEDLPGGTMTAIVAFDLRVDQYGLLGTSGGPTPNAVVAAVSIGTETQVILATAGHKTWTVGLLEGNNLRASLPVKLTLTGWERLSLEVSIPTSATTALDVQVGVQTGDGGPVGIAANGPLAFDGCDPSCALTSAAVGLEPSSGTWTVYFDDVVIDANTMGM